MLNAVKPKLHYHSLLDTVQFGQSVVPKTFVSRAVNVTGLLMLDMLVGNATPLLSQTQAFDNALLLAQLAEPSNDSRSFLRLVRKGRIQVRVAGAPSLLEAFRDALREPDFVLSAWPELSDAQLRAEVVRCSLTDDIDQLGHASLAARLEGVRQFDDSLRQSPTMQWHAAMTRNDHLSLRIMEGLRELSSTDPASRQAARWLLASAQSLFPTQQELRSVWYGLLDELEKSGGKARLGNTRGIIDGAYNSVVANSLGATGMFAQCPTEEVATALASVELNGVAGGQLVKLMPDERRYMWLKWEKGDKWLDEYGHISKPGHRLDYLVKQGYVGLVELDRRPGIALKVALPSAATGLVASEMAREANELREGGMGGVEGGAISGVVSLLAALPVVERTKASLGTNRRRAGEHWEYTVTTGTASWQKSVLPATVTAWSPRRLGPLWFRRGKPG